VESAYRISFKSLARRYLELHDEIADLDAMIGAIVEELAPDLVHATRSDIPAPHSFCSRLAITRSACARRPASRLLCGVSPVPASSGKTIRHRLNRVATERQQRIAHHRYRSSSNRSGRQKLCGEAYRGGHSNSTPFEP
jgi:hypothetical protein